MVCPFRLPENDEGGVYGHRVRYSSGVGGIRESDFIGKGKCRLLFGFSDDLRSSLHSGILD